MSYRRRSETVSGYLQKIPKISWDELTLEETQLRLAEIRGQARKFYNMPIRSDDHIYEELERKRYLEEKSERYYMIYGGSLREQLEKLAHRMMTDPSMVRKSFDSVIIDEAHYFEPRRRIPVIDEIQPYTYELPDKPPERPSIRFKMEGAIIRKPPKS